MQHNFNTRGNVDHELQLRRDILKRTGFLDYQLSELSALTLASDGLFKPITYGGTLNKALTDVIFTL